jgi:predicted RNase H-like HicB family nuclease
MNNRTGTYRVVPFGTTEEEALKEVTVAMDPWLEAARNEGRKLPKPRGKGLLKLMIEESGGDFSAVS